MLRIILVLAASVAAAVHAQTNLTASPQHEISDSAKAAETVFFMTRIAALETEVAALAKREARIEDDAMWESGAQLQGSVGMMVISAGLGATSTIFALNDETRAALLTGIGSVGFNVLSLVNLYRAGSELKRAAMATPVTPKPIVRRDQAPVKGDSQSAPEAIIGVVMVVGLASALFLWFTL